MNFASTWWIWASIAAVIVLLVIGAFALFRWRRARRQKAKEAAPLPEPWPRNKLSSAYPRFRKELSQDTRRYLWRLPIFVIVGEQGAGTGRLIDANVDWRAQRLKFAPSDTVDNDVKIHLGAHEVAIQLSADLLNAEPEQVGPALRRFWRSLPRQKRPTVVLCVDAPTLPSRSEVDLARLGTVVRGKINLLSAASGGNIDVRIHLSRMDEIEGYEDFARLALRLGLHDSIVPRGTSRDLAEDLFADFERYLPRALERGAESFAGVARFLQDVRPYVGALGPLIEALTIEEEISAPLHLDGISFSATSGDLQVGRPFAPPPGQARRVRVYQKQAALRAAAVFAGLSLLTTGIYWLQYQAFSSIHDEFQTTRGWQPASVTAGPEEAWVLDAVSENRRAALFENVAEPLERVAAWQRWWPPLALSYHRLRDAEREKLGCMFFDGSHRGARANVDANLSHTPAHSSATQSCVVPPTSLLRERRRFVHHLKSEYQEGSIAPSEVELVHASARRLTAALWIHELDGGGAGEISWGERRAINDLVGQILDLSPSLPAVPDEGTLRSLMHRLDELQRVAERPDIEEDWDVTIAGLDFTFGDWKQFVVKSWGTQLVDDFVSTDRFQTASLRRFPFFHDPQAYTDVVIREAGSGGTHVPGVYTHGAAFGEFAPMLERYRSSAWHLPDSATRRLAEFVEEEKQIYERSYLAHWRHHFESIDFSWATEPNLLIAALRVPPERSVFTKILEAIEINTSTPEEPSSQLEGLWASLEPLAPLLGTDGQGLDLAGYFAALDELAASVPLRGNRNDGADTEQRLALLRGADESPESKARAWLLVAGITSSDLQAPFLAPFEQARFLAARQLRGAADTGLTEQLDSVARLRTKFPFRQDADAVLTVEELEAVLKPGSGEFWRIFEARVAPLCVREPDGSWRSDPALDVVIAPDDLATVNALADFASRLWDEEGNRKTIPVTVNPLPLDRSAPGEPMITQTYIRFGENQVFGFNQMPTPTTIQWAWWETGGAELGMETTMPDTREVNRRSIEEFDSPWSVLRILDRADEYSDSGLVGWRLSLRSGGPRVGVNFQFAADPRDVFRRL